MKKIKPAKPKETKTKSVDYLILLIFILSLIVPIIIASTQYYITQYGDDVAMISWGQKHHSNILDIFSKTGTGFRPIMNLWFFIGYNLWGSDAFSYHLLNGIVFSLAMVFLYLLGKTLNGRKAGLIAVLLYLILDGTFIMNAKLGFIAFSGEIFFITSALYYSIRYFKTNDKLSMWLAIILSTLAFLSKEPSILIIPVVNLTYLWYNGLLKKNYIIMNLIPFIYLGLSLFISPDLGAGDNVNLLQRISNNFKFYVDTEINYQFKTPVLLAISILIAGYYYVTRKLRSEIIMCAMWFIVGVLPLLIFGQPVQHTYLIEANLGMVLLIGIVISEGLKKNNLIMGLLIIGILFQVLMIPGQISNMRNYNHMVADNQKTFFETVEAIKQLPSNETITVFYFSDNVRQKYGMQLTEDFFKDYLCLRNLCNIKVVTSYADANYIILPSSLDIYTFQKEMPNEKPSVIKQIKNGNDYGLLLKK